VVGRMSLLATSEIIRMRHVAKHTIVATHCPTCKGTRVFKTLSFLASRGMPAMTASPLLRDPNPPDPESETLNPHVLQNGRTPLHLALKKKHGAVAKMLRQAGARR